MQQATKKKAFKNPPTLTSTTDYFTFVCDIVLLFFDFIMSSVSLVVVLLAAVIAVVMGDTPAHCLDTGFVGTWDFHVGRPRGSSFNCSSLNPEDLAVQHTETVRTLFLERFLFVFWGN